jgi:hypothetical protein
MLFSWPRRNRRSKLSPRQAQLRLEPLEDRRLLSVFTVTNTSDFGTGSLDEAITDANASGVASQIDFNIGSGGAQTIMIQSLLPALGNSITIDGSTEPGFTGAPLVTIYDLDPQHILPGLSVAGNGDTVRALHFAGFTALPGPLPPLGPLPNPLNGYAVVVSGDNDLIVGNQIPDILVVTGSNDTIGGTSASEGNTLGSVLVGNQSGATASGDVLEGNTIALDVTATNTTALTIGGSMAGAGNVSSGSIQISKSSGAVVQGNTLDMSDQDQFATTVGLDDATNCTLGGTTALARNVINGAATKIRIISEVSPATVLNDVVEGNYIGTLADGQSPPPSISFSPGILVDSSGNTIINNTIAFSGVYEAGIEIFGGTGNRISQNSMFDNGTTGIQLGDGAANVYKPNGVNPGTGPNDSQNFPVIASAVESGGNTVITGTLNSAANSTYTLEFFAATALDTGGYVEGKTYLGSQSVTTDAGGNASFTFTGPADAGPLYTATATDSNGNTSEFWQPNRPAPTITNIQLSQISLGFENAAGQPLVRIQLTLTGSNFYTTTSEEDSKVNTTQIMYISPTEFEVTQFLHGVDSVTLNLFNPGPAGGASNSVSFAFSANQIYVIQLYETLFNRIADMPGLAFWASQLDAGASRAQVVAQMETTREYRGLQVQALYQHYMHRAADPSGLGGGVAFLLSGGTVEQLTAALVGSPEYYQVIGGGTNNGFLGALYHDALGRLLDPGGQAAWIQAFANGATPYQVGGAVLTSLEYRQDLVHSYYSAYLFRDPDSAGLAGWVALMENGTRDETVIAGITGSAEFLYDVTVLFFYPR